MRRYFDFVAADGRPVLRQTARVLLGGLKPCVGRWYEILIAIGAFMVFLVDPLLYVREEDVCEDIRSLKY